LKLKLISVTLDFGVTQNSIYFPKATRVWASMAGIEPQIMDIKGTNAHWANMAAVLVHLYLAGRGGSKTILI
jgi:ABC-type uncharacterized transport system permease subunit